MKEVPLKRNFLDHLTLLKLKPSLKIFLTVYIGLGLISAYLIGSSYFRYLKQAEENTLSRLFSIASTLAQQVDQEAIQAVFERYPFDGDTTGVASDPTVKMYAELFSKAAMTNGLKTPIYTLTFDTTRNMFVGGISSTGTIAYSWQYESPPQKLKTIYSSGGTIPQFTDDHGTWLSAVYPLRNTDGDVFAVIEADYPFDSFLENARKEVLGSVLVSVLVMVLIGIIIYPVLSQILRSEEQSRSNLEKTKDMLQEKNDEVMSSLSYARTIQETMLPKDEDACRFFGHWSVYNRPRDVVSGDFYWFHQLDEQQALVAVADCTGHGVPGALMSIMGHSYLNEIVIEQEVHSPCEVLERLDSKILEAFSPSSDASKVTDGMDVGICLVDKGENVIIFAGARRPLVIFDNGIDRMVSGTKRGIGEHFLAINTPFRNVQLPLTKGSSLFLFTDGLQDQFGGPDGKKLMSKGLISLLRKTVETPPAQSAAMIDREFIHWKGNLDQVDDICLVSFAI